MEPNNFSNNGRVYTGAFLIGAGLLLLASKLGAPLPPWLFTWPVALIAVGVLISVRHNFQNVGGLILILIGSLNLIDVFNPGMNLRSFFAPIIIISVGALFLFRPRRGNCRHGGRWRQRWNEKYNNETATATSFPEDEKKNDEDFVDSVSVFSGLKKVVFSKNFKGGDITCFMGGAEINLSQAEIKEPAVLEVTQVFGGTKLIVPPDWHIRSEIIAMFSGVEDKRPIQAGNISPDKLLILKGTSVFGGIDIRSY